jgi:hypothetical protein
MFIDRVGGGEGVEFKGIFQDEEQVEGIPSVDLRWMNWELEKGA